MNYRNFLLKTKLTTATTNSHYIPREYVKFSEKQSRAEQTATDSR